MRTFFLSKKYTVSYGNTITVSLRYKQGARLQDCELIAFISGDTQGSYECYT